MFSVLVIFLFSSRRRHTRLTCDWSSDVCSSDLLPLFKYLLPSLTESLEPDRYRYDISLGADQGDPWYDNRTRQAHMQRWRSEERRVGKECRCCWYASS